MTNAAKHLVAKIHREMQPSERREFQDFYSSIVEHVRRNTLPMSTCFDYFVADVCFYLTKQSFVGVMHSDEDFSLSASIMHESLIEVRFSCKTAVFGCP